MRLITKEEIETAVVNSNLDNKDATAVLDDKGFKHLNQVLAKEVADSINLMGGDQLRLLVTTLLAMGIKIGMFIEKDRHELIN